MRLVGFILAYVWDTYHHSLFVFRRPMCRWPKSPSFYYYRSVGLSRLLYYVGVRSYIMLESAHVLCRSRLMYYVGVGSCIMSESAHVLCRSRLIYYVGVRSYIMSLLQVCGAESAHEVDEHHDDRSPQRPHRARSPQSTDQVAEGTDRTRRGSRSRRPETTPIVTKR